MGACLGENSVQAAMESCLEICVVEKCNDRVLIHFHTIRTAVNCKQGKI